MTNAKITLYLAKAWHILVAFVYIHPISSPCNKYLKQVLYDICKRPFTKYIHRFALLSCLRIFCGSIRAPPLQDTSVGETENELVKATIALQTMCFGLLCLKVCSNIVTVGPDRIIAFEREKEKADILNFKPLPLWFFNALFSPQYAISRPEVTGLENIPADKPALFVMNHSIVGFEMGPLLHILYKEKGIYLRGLADHVLYSLLGPCFRLVGAVDGTRANVDTLMRSGENILVYPGGAHEFFRHSSGPNYTLLFKERLGFARMAIKHGYQIIPCCAVGVEDTFDVVADIPIFTNSILCPYSRPTQGDCKRLPLVRHTYTNQQV